MVSVARATAIRSSFGSASTGNRPPSTVRISSASLLAPNASSPPSYVIPPIPIPACFAASSMRGRYVSSAFCSSAVPPAVGLPE